MRAAQVAHGLAHGFGQAAVQVALDQMHDHFGVGIRHKDRALCDQFFFQFAVVFHDAVMHHDHIAVHAHVGVGVTRAGFAVRGPARVADADLAADGVLFKEAHQVIELAYIAQQGDVRVLDHRQPGGVIAPVFKALETGQHDRGGVLRADVTNDSTHKIALPVLFICKMAHGTHRPAHVTRAAQTACGLWGRGARAITDTCFVCAGRSFVTYLVMGKGQ